MKVLKITSWYPNSLSPLLGSFVNDQAKALRDINIDVGVLFVDMGVHHFFSKLFNYSNKPSFEIEDGIPTYRYQGLFLPKWNPTIFKKWNQYFDILYQEYIAKNGTPDILHAHHYQAGYAAYYLSQKYNLPFIITEHGTIFLRTDLNGTQKKIAQTTFDHANTIIAVSTGLKSAIQKYTNQEIIVVPNLIDTSLFHPNVEQKKLQQKTKLIAIGDLIKRKRFNLIIEAISKMSLKKRKLIELKIIGDGPEKNTLQSLINKNQLTEQVFLVGELKREEVATHLRNSDFFILSSSFETFGIVVIEAIASGVPVISTRCQGPEDIVNNRNGLLIPIDDVVELKNAIEKMQSNYHKYNTSFMRNEIVKKYDKKIIAHRLLEIYQTVLA